MESGGGQVTAPLLLDVSPGCSIWHRLPTGEMPPGEYRRGGRVYAIEETHDEDTGFPKRRFFVVDTQRRRLHFDVLEEEDISRELVDPYSASFVRNAVRRLCQEIGEGKGLWLTNDMRSLDAAKRLASTLVATGKRRETVAG